MASLQEKIFFELHQNNRQEGPGGSEFTRQAYRQLEDLPPRPWVLDVGCGPGRQTLDLGRLSDGRFAAVDNHTPFLNTLRESVALAGLSDRIFPVRGDMHALSFPRACFDLIWAEGSIYIMGFEEGLRQLKPFLKPGGYLVVTEACWLRSDAPRDLADFWQAAYPAMQSIPENLGAIRAGGYYVVGHFVLPETAWWDDYYIPLEKKMALLETKYRHEPAALEVLGEERREIALYRRYSAYYGYVFFLCRCL